MKAARPLKVITWPGMPAAESLHRAADRLGRALSVSRISANETLEAELDQADPGSIDLIFPSDYLVERLIRDHGLLSLQGAGLQLEVLAPWALSAAHDPGCRWSVPFAFGTTGYLTTVGDASSWSEVFEPRPGLRIGMLEEARELIGAALIAAGRDPNDTDERSLEAAGAMLERQRPFVLRYDSDDFITPVLRGEVDIHHAWSGPAALAVINQPLLQYVVPEEGAILWVTCAAIPADAPQPEVSLELLRELMRPELASLATLHGGYATPNEQARALLPAELRNHSDLFPHDDTLARCRVLRDLGPEEERLCNTWLPGPGSRPH